MTLAFYADAHVPGAVVDGLRLRGVDVLTAQEDGTDELPDPALLDRATSMDRPLISMDEDLLAEAKRRQAQEVHFAGVIYAHQLNISIGRFIDDVVLIAGAGDLDYMRNRVEWLPL